MDAYPSNSANPLYSEDDPLLLFASSDSAMARAERAINACGLRVGARLPIERASERLAVQAKASAVWIEVDGDCGPVTDKVLRQVSKDASEGRYVAVVSATVDLLDAVTAAVEATEVELIVDANDVERTAALATVTAGLGSSLQVRDVGSDNNAERLRQLSEEVSRIASTLARLSTGPGAPVRAIEQSASGDAPPLSVEIVRSVIRARRLRARYFHEELFADPAWDMLLDLLQAEIAQLRVPVSSLCIAAAVPATTALRWLKTMVSQGLFHRRADPHDGRRVFVELAPEASQALRRYFAEVGPVAVI